MIIFIFLQKENFRESLIDILHNVDNAIIDGFQDNDDSADAATLEHTVNTAVYNTTYILTYTYILYIL